MIGSLRLKLSGRAETAKRFGWGFADQALSSLTNFVLSFLVVRNVGTKELGAFGLMFATYLLVLGLCTSISTSLLLIRYSSVRHDQWRRGVMSATGTSVTVGMISGVVVSAVSLLYLEGSIRATYLALAVSLPGLMLQDAWRQAFFAQGRASRAFFNDLVWAFFLLPAAIMMDKAESVPVSWFVLAWGGSASLAAAVGFIQSRVVPRPQRILSWWREHRDLSGWFLASYAVGNAAGQASNYLLVALTSLRTMGALGSVGVLFGPLNIVITGTGLVALPEAVRALRNNTRRLRLLVMLLSTGLILVSAVWTIVILLLPSSIGELLLRENWHVAQPLLLLQGLHAMAWVARFGAQMGLAALEAAKQSMTSGAWISVLTVSLPAAGAVIEGGPRGILYGAIVAQVAATCIHWVYYRRAEARRDEDLRASAVVGS